jgi:hypothetical protein
LVADNPAGVVNSPPAASQAPRQSRQRQQALVPRLCRGFSFLDRRPPDYFAEYLTVYNTVSLASPARRPTVTVTRFSGP